MIPEKNLAILTARGFADSVLEIANTDAAIDLNGAYERTEELHLTLMGRRKYSDFDSFAKMARIEPVYFRENYGMPTYVTMLS